MKKQFITKLLVLVMVLSMVPAAAVAADMGVIAYNSGVSTLAAGNTNPYYNPNNNSYDNPYDTPNYNPYSNPYSNPYDNPYDTPDMQGASGTPTTPSKPGAAEKAPEVVETVGVKTETNAAGETVLSAVIEVKDATAPVEISEKALDILIEQAKAGDIVSIVPKTTGAVSVPAAKLAALVEKTGKPVEVGNSVAVAKINKALLELAGSAELKIAPVKNSDGTISIPITAGGKVIAPEDVPGGIDVEVPVDYTADEVSSVNAVKADKSEVELVWSISLGNLQVNLTVTGAIKIVPSK